MPSIPVAFDVVITRCRRELARRNKGQDPRSHVGLKVLKLRTAMRCSLSLGRFQLINRGRNEVINSFHSLGPILARHLGCLRPGEEIQGVTELVKPKVDHLERIGT